VNLQRETAALNVSPLAHPGTFGVNGLPEGDRNERRDVMKRRSLWIGAFMVVMLAAASVVALTGLGGSVGAADDLVIQGPPHGGGGCICPANFEPVVCIASDGTRHAFSNACVAGCSGYTQCARVVVAGP
jgi:hypothetical protein